jgi:hypothetical protein
VNVVVVVPASAIFEDAIAMPELRRLQHFASVATIKMGRGNGEGIPEGHTLHTPALAIGPTDSLVHTYTHLPTPNMVAKRVLNVC